MSDTTNNSTTPAAASADGALSNTKNLGVESYSFDEGGTIADLTQEPATFEETVEPTKEVPAKKTDEAAATDEAPAAEGDKDAEAATDADVAELSDTLDITAYQKEFDANGSLSDKTYEQIEKLTKLDRGTIDSIVDAMKARQDGLVKRWEGILGGDDQKNSIMDWARENYSAPKRNSFNKIMDSNDTNAIELALQGMVADYKAAGGTFEAGVSVTNDSANLGARQGSVQGYKSEVEHRNDVRSKKYKTDPAFREEVKNRVRASAWFKG